MLKLTLIICLVSLVACTSGFESQEYRPYESGITTGELLPVLPVFPKDEIIKKSKEKKQSEISSPEIIFKNLQFELDIDDASVEGSKNISAKYSAHLKGQMIINKKVKEINIKNIYVRYDQESKEDQLEKMKNSWQFVLVSKQRDFMADIRCIKAWDCKTIVAELYWYESEGLLRRRQFHIEGSIQLQRQEQIEEAVDQPATTITIEDPVVYEEVHNHEPESDTGPTNASEYRFITFTEEFIKPDETIYFELNNEAEKSEEEDVDDIAEAGVVSDEEQSDAIISSPIKRDIVSEAIEADASMHRPDMPVFDYALPIGAMKRLKLENFVFEFKAIEEGYIYGSDIPNQSMGCPAKKASGSDCRDGGSLENSEALNFIEATNDVIGQSPYVAYSDSSKQFGTSVMIKFIESISKSFYDKTSKTTYVGDISTANGGEMSGHSSHQNGLDVDIRLVTTDNRNAPYDINNDNSESLDVSGMYDFIIAIYSTAKVYDSSNQQVYSYINAIFLNNLIKKKLCEYAKSKDSIAFSDPKSDVFQALKRIRPEAKHTNHMHIRLNCHSNFCRDYSDKNSISPNSNGCGL